MTKKIGWQKYEALLEEQMSSTLIMDLLKAQADDDEEMVYRDPEDIDEDLNELIVGACPEKRVIKNAPKEYLAKVNPLRKEPRNLKKGKVLYRIKAKRACKFCHGMEGLGDGSMSDLQPMPPRNFTCRNYMNKIKDGDLFWVIKEGISDSGMPSYKHLSDKKIWQLIHYIRTFSR